LYDITYMLSLRPTSVAQLTVYSIVALWTSTTCCMW